MAVALFVALVLHLVSLSTLSRIGLPLLSFLAAGLGSMAEARASEAVVAEWVPSATLYALALTAAAITQVS